MSCPCGSALTYEDCCGRFHAKTARPDTAEQLMRSRYSAYVKRNMGWLLATHDPSRRADFNPIFAAQWAAEADWRRLDILATERGGTGDETGMVEFIAWYLINGQLTCHHERSDFRRVDGDWVYVDGAGKPAAMIMSELKRNAPCPCGSSRKYGRCHVNQA